MEYTVKKLSNYFLVLDSSEKTVKVYPEKNAADMYCRLLNNGSAV